MVGQVHGVLFRPRNGSSAAAAGTAPPVVVTCHGGPTAQASGGFDPLVALLTSRGYAVVAAELRRIDRLRRGLTATGSTRPGASPTSRTAWRWWPGWPREARSMPTERRSEGGAPAASRRCWRPPPAPSPAPCPGTGWPTCSTLVATTHDFESRYCDSARRARCPRPGPATSSGRPSSRAAEMQRRRCLLLQGSEDPVVPPAQSEAMAEALRARRQRGELLEFAGESHGFRRLETLVAAYEAELAFYDRVLCSGEAAEAPGSSGPPEIDRACPTVTEPLVVPSDPGTQHVPRELRRRALRPLDLSSPPVATFGSKIPLYRQWGQLALIPYLVAALAAALLAVAARSPEGARGADRAERAGLRRRRRRPVGLRGGVALRGHAPEPPRPAGGHRRRACGRRASAMGQDPYRARMVDGGAQGRVAGLPAYEAFFPYLPAMTAFGLPAATSLPKELTDARIYFVLVTLACVLAALWCAPTSGSRAATSGLRRWRSCCPGRRWPWRPVATTCPSSACSWSASSSLSSDGRAGRASSSGWRRP